MHVSRALLLGAAALFCAGCSTQRCSPATCSGCCSGEVCLSGDSPQACGSSGRACASCSSGDTCFFSVCAHRNGGGPGGGAGGGSGGGSGGGTGGGGGGVTQPSTRFSATALDWPVPDSQTASGFYAASVGNNTSQWATLDLDGDGRPDLVQTADPASVGPTPWLGSGVGNATWHVFKNTGQGFSLTPIDWALPGMVSTVDYSAVSGIAVNALWATIDVDGDGRPDLVRSADPSVGKNAFDGGASGAYWEVYLNTGAGFSSTATRWTLPSSGLPAGFWKVTSATANENWGLYDLDGDRQVELVQTSDPVTSNGVFGGSNGNAPYWRVFPRSGMGFAVTATQWSVPADNTAGGFYLPFAAGALRNWGLFDLDGDRRLDLVQTSDPTQLSTVFGPSPAWWNVYRGGPGGFQGAATSYAVPESGTDGGFYTAAAFTPPSAWATVDLDGDGRVDLVQTADPAQGRGPFGDQNAGQYWRLFRGGPNGFAAGQSFSVPPSGTTNGFATLVGLGGQDNWLVVDLDGDGRPDLVQTSDPAQNNHVFGGAGATGAYWRVFRGTP